MSNKNLSNSHKGNNLAQSHVINPNSSKKNSLENADAPKNNPLLSNSTPITSLKKLSDPINDKVKATYPSELKTIDSLISKTNIKFHKYQERYLYYRDAGLNIYEALSYYYVEEIFKNTTIAFIASFIDLLKGPEYHILTIPQFSVINKKISNEMKEKYLRAHQNLIVLFETYLDILLNDKEKRYNVIYDFYSQCSQKEDLRLACNALIRGVTAGFYLSNNKNMANTYKIFNIEENKSTKVDLELITNATDITIDIYDCSKSGEVISTRYNYGVEKGGNFIRILSYGISYYNLYEKDQKPHLEKAIFGSLQKSENIPLKPKPEQIENIKNEGNIKKNEVQISNKQEKPDINQQVPSSEGKKDYLEEKNDFTFENNLNKICEKCKEKNHSKPLFSIKTCKHVICFKCMISNYLKKGFYSYKESHFCPVYTCSYRFDDEDVQEYFNEIQISESITMLKASSSNEKQKNQESSHENKNKENEMELEDEPGVINLEPKIKCCSCNKDTPQSEIFNNPECFHCFCHECVSNKLLRAKSYNFCPVRTCNKFLQQKTIEKFLQDFRSRDTKKNLIEVVQTCYSCNKKFKISFALGADLDFFNCKSCKVTSCLLHCAPLNKCFCYCEKCNIKTEPDWLKPSCRYCPDCKRKFCLLCQDSLAHCHCYCKKCDSILENQKEEVCNECKETCYLCGVKTIERNQIYGKCAHLYCKGCVYEKFVEFEKHGCLKKPY